MPRSRDIWQQVCRTTRLADRSTDDFTIKRLKIVAAELTALAIEAEDNEGKRRRRGYALPPA